MLSILKAVLISNIHGGHSRRIMMNKANFTTEPEVSPGRRPNAELHPQRPHHRHHHSHRFHDLHPDCDDTDVDGDTILTDKYGDGCSWYRDHPHTCGHGDDADFIAETLCCSCHDMGAQHWHNPSFYARLPGLGLARGSISGWARAIKFLSLPFAVPPVGPLALRPATELPDENWGQQRGSLDFPSPCFQFTWLPELVNQIYEYLGDHGGRGYVQRGQQDCLYVNVFVPQDRGERLLIDKSTDLPTMFFIHGGAFHTGDSFSHGLYDPSGLVEKTGVIAVSSQYRLGPEGFMAHPAMRKLGSKYNLGLLDQRLAMKWVHRHIGSFGGDPNRVTIFGESAGAMSICFHLTSPQSFPFFSGAIMQSPGCEGASNWIERSRAEAFAKAVSVSLNCTAAPPAVNVSSGSWAVGNVSLEPASDEEAIKELECLQQNMHRYESKSMTEWVDLILPYGYVPDAPLLFAPVVDLEEWGLQKMPNELVEDGQFNRVPIITGTNKNEGTVFTSMNFVPGQDKQAFVDYTFHIVGPDYVDDIYNIYGPISSESEFSQALDLFMGDSLFVCPTHFFVEAVRQHSPDIYYYRFVHELSNSQFLLQAWAVARGFVSGASLSVDRAFGLAMSAMGVPHGFDLFFVFDSKDNPLDESLQFSDYEARVSEFFIAYWGQHAWEGSPEGSFAPVGPNREDMPTPAWPAWTEDNHTIMRLGYEPSTRPIANDIEADVERRCSWFRDHKDSLRARSKPWQTAQLSVGNLGLRCCCDTSQDPPICNRVRVDELKTDGHCPSVDYGRGVVQTHHDSLGCVSADHDALRCCCLNHVEVPDAFQTDIANPQPICQHLVDGELNWRGHCPEICSWDTDGELDDNGDRVQRERKFEPCVNSAYSWNGIGSTRVYSHAAEHLDGHCS